MEYFDLFITSACRMSEPCKSPIKKPYDRSGSNKILEPDDGAALYDPTRTELLSLRARALKTLLTPQLI